MKKNTKIIIVVSAIAVGAFVIASIIFYLKRKNRSSGIVEQPEGIDESTNGFKIPGTDSGGWFGMSVSSAGDINNDGKNDIVVGAPLTSFGLDAAYVIFGSNSFDTSFNLTRLDGTNGFKIPGIDSGGYFGTSVSNAGDINNDGKNDLVVGAAHASSYLGAAYVIFGADSFATPFDLTRLDGTNGFKIPGIIFGFGQHAIMILIQKDNHSGQDQTESDRGSPGEQY